MALTDELIQEVITAAVNARCSNTQFARAIESAACADRDARIAKLERENGQLNATLAEARKDAERYRWLQQNISHLDSAIDAAMKGQQSI